MSELQRDIVARILRESPIDLGGEVAEQRELFRKLIGAEPLPEDVTVTPAVLDGVPAVSVSAGPVSAGPKAAGPVSVGSVPAGPDPAADTVDGTVLYFHGGCFAVGSAESSTGLAGHLARAAGVRVLSVDYRLAPEHPYPAALQDALAAYRALVREQGGAGRIAVVGESAGGNLAAALLLAVREEPDLPQPACAMLLSPWADLTVPDLPDDPGLDPVITARALRIRAQDYLQGADPHDGLVSPVHADLTGLPPLLIQAGSAEYLRDDAIRLAARAAAHHVQVTLDITPHVPHVFQAFASILDEAAEALTRAAAFLHTHLR
jgi:acetyl esterase/lipase